MYDKIQELKPALFEFFAAGFQAAINGETLADAYNKYWNFIIQLVK